MRIRLFTLFLILTNLVFAQINIDSIRSIVSSNVSDTVKIKNLLLLTEYCQDNSNNKCVEYLNQAFAIAKKSDYKKYISEISNQLGRNYYYLGDYKRAVKNFLISLEANESLKDEVGIASCLNNIGSIYIGQEDYGKALEYHLKALNLRQENFKKGLGDENDIAMSYGNIGQAYFYLNNLVKAMEYYNKSLKISENIGNKERVALMLNNIGSIYGQQKDYENALLYYTRSLQIQRQLNDKQNVAMALNNIASVYLAKLDYVNAIKLFNQGLDLSKQNGYLDDLKTSYEGLNSCYVGLNDYKNAHTYLSLFHSIKDSIYNTENSSQLNEMLTKFDTNSKEQEIQLLQKDQQIHKYFRNSLIVGFILIFILALLLFSRNKVKQRANNELAKKNSYIEEKNEHIQLQHKQLEYKNKEITDSIQYAKNLQLAILPPDNQIKRLLPDSFVLYKPKDIVSGDFYWVEEWGSQILVAAADCTGHGVPGAFMSILGNNLLQQAVFHFGLEKPFLILNNINKNISRMLHQSQDTSSVKDGMDIALISIDKTKNILEFAGAFNPLWIFRNAALIEIKGDKHPVGAFIDEELKPFNHHEFKLQKDDVIYIFTDGYADQFGGINKKKFMVKKLKELIHSIHQLPMQGQESELLKQHILWKEEVEQTDDILIIGIKI